MGLSVIVSEDDVRCAPTVKLFSHEFSSTVLEPVAFYCHHLYIRIFLYLVSESPVAFHGGRCLHVACYLYHFATSVKHRCDILAHGTPDNFIVCCYVCCVLV